MPLIGEFFSLLCAVAWALAIIYFRIAGGSVPAVELNLIKNVIAMVLLGLTWLLLALLFPEHHAHPFSLQELGWLVLSGLIGITFADTLLLKSLGWIGASRNAVLSCLFSPFVIVLAVLFLGERFHGLQVLGFGIVVVGTLLVSWRREGEVLDRSLLRKGSAVGVVAVFLMAVGMTITKPIVNDASAIATAAVRMMAGATGSVIWVLISGRARRSWRVLRADLPWKAILLSTFLGSYLALMFWVFGFQQTEASTASVLNQTSVLFTLVFAVWILKEPVGARKIAGACLGFVGVAVLFLAP